MERINGIKKLTDNRFLNLYEQDAVFRDGSRAPYYVASRRKNVEDLKSVTHDNLPDGVILYGVRREPGSGSPGAPVPLSCERLRL